MPYGDPRDLDTFNDNFDDEPDLCTRSEMACGPMREPCPECSEPAVAAWDHLEECPYYEKMMDLPF